MIRKRWIDINDKTQFIIVSHFNDKKENTTKNLLERIMIKLAKDKIKAIKQN